MIYVIIKTGVYRHDVFGVFDDLEEAKKTAKVLATKDRDSYHDYDVIKTTFNSSPRVRFSQVFGCESMSDDIVFSVNKNNILKE